MRNDRQPFTVNNFVMFNCSECNNKVLSLKDFSVPNFIIEVNSLWNKFLTEVGDEFGRIDPKVLCKGFRGMERPKFEDDDGNNISDKMEEKFGEALSLFISQNVARDSKSICYNCLISKASNTLHLTDSKDFTDVAYNILLDWEMSKREYELKSKNKHKPFYKLEWKHQVEIINEMRNYYSEYRFYTKLGSNIQKRMMAILPSFLTVIDYIIDNKKFNVTAMDLTWEKS